MPYELYKVLHIIGVVSVWGGLSAAVLHAVNGGTKQTNPNHKLIAMTHGVGMFLILLGGFGMLARLGMTDGIPGWIWLKLTIWLVVGALLMVPLRVPKLAKPMWFALPIIAGLATYIAMTKPF